MLEKLQDGDLAKGLCQVVIVEAGFVDYFDGNLRKNERKS
jgi:hypothetical protein